MVAVGAGELVNVEVGEGVSDAVGVGEGVGEGGFPTTVKKFTRFQSTPMKS
jgi:hypothetical protein